MARALLALGANIGDRTATLDAAVMRLAATADTRVLACSRWHETAPIGGPAGQDVYLNGAIAIETSLAPERLLSRLHEIEQTLGRERTIVWGPRTIDIDLLLYDERRINTSVLKVPHPRMAIRRFVLAPAVEVAAEWRDPASGWTIARLWDHLRRAFPYFALTSIPGANQTRLAQEVLRDQSGELLSDALPREVTAQVLRAHQRVRERMLEQVESLTTPVVSDFWLDEIPVIAEAYHSVDSDDSMPELKAIARSVVAPLAPKVRIWVEPATCEGDRSRQMRDSLCQAVTAPGRGPWLCVTAADWEGAVREITAALAGA